ncbi:MAG: RluA family pseudouridine synthase [Eubacteriales bacterium]|nr:RluA family pseudouridine synthase [Eubacteriales bacterium]
MFELTYRITGEEEGLPVRRIALGRMRMSSSQFKSAKFEGELLLDGQSVHADARVRAGQTLTVRMPEQAGAACQPYDLPLTVPYEDDDLLVIDKPAPLASISSSRKGGDTLENAVYSYLHCPADFLYRPVNRLDKGTSGLMVVAKHAHAQQFLQAELHSEDFAREYLAVTDGVPLWDEGVIDLSIAKAEGATIRRVVDANGRPARTQCRVLQRGKERTLLWLKLDTGRTHQIRVHLSTLGCPVTGDFLYGAETAELPGRFALHSHRLRLKTLSNGTIDLVSPLPDELQRLLR